MSKYDFLYRVSLHQLRKMLEHGILSSDELAQYFCNRIERFNPELNAVISSVALTPNPTNPSPSTNRPLTGIPIIHKDVFCTAGHATTAASRFLHNYVPCFDAHIVEQLTKAGVQNIAKSNMDEFAMGSSNENSAYGPVKNPWNHAYSPGGSSGGSAACVAAGLTPVATGSDTGGSIRTPASHCGITGIKSSYGMVSRFGMIAYASSLDQAGVFARRAEDCANVLEVMMAFDSRDSTQIPANIRPAVNFQDALSQPIRGQKIGVCTSLINQCHESQRSRLQTAIEQLVDLGAQLVDIELSYIDEALAAYYIIATAEASSNLARFDGIHYGQRSESVKEIAHLFSKSRMEGFGDEVKRRILLGTFVLSHGYYDAYYQSALKVRRLITNMFTECFKQCQILALPVSPTPAPKRGTHQHALDEYWTDVFTVPINLAGLPALSMPVGQTDESLPIGLQLTGPYFSEAQLLQCAHQFQQHTNHHLQIPPHYDES